jgi:hypothetical protein
MDKEFWRLPHGFTIFSDDIRQEVGGKVTLVGVYNGVLLTNAFPLMLPKFCFSTRYREPIMDKRADTIEFKMFIDDNDGEKVLFHNNIVVSDLNPNIVSDKNQELDATTFWELVVNGAISPLLIGGPSKIRMRAYRDEKEHRLGALIVRTPTEAEQITLSGGTGDGADDDAV